MRVNQVVVLALLWFQRFTLLFSKNRVEGRISKPQRIREMDHKEETEKSFTILSLYTNLKFRVILFIFSFMHCRNVLEESNL